MDYNECCRSCLQPISDKVNLLTDVKIRNLFEDCIRTTVNNDDFLPKYLCFICYGKCNKWKEFQEECKQNEDFLKNWSFNEGMSTFKTEIEFLNVEIKEESDTDDERFDLMPTHNDHSSNDSDSDSKLKSVILNTICEVKLEDIGKRREISTRSRVVIDDEFIKFEATPKQVKKPGLKGGTTILAPKRIIVTKNTDLSKLNVSTKCNYTEWIEDEPKNVNNANKKLLNVSNTDTRTINESSHPVSSETLKNLNSENYSKENLMIDSQNHSASETEKLKSENITDSLSDTKTNNEFSQPVSEQLNSEIKEKLLTARKSTKRVYCEDSDDDLRKDDKDNDFGRKPNLPKPVFKCITCRKMFKVFEVYELHFLCVHMGKEPFECKICNAKYARSNKFENHLLKEHIPTVLTPKYFCSDCEQGFETELQLKKHSRVHVVNSCDKCARVFTRRKNLLDHINHAHSNKEKIIRQCSQCERSFVHKSSLDAHIKQDHLKDLSFICNICGKLFATNSKLLTHIKTHSEERPHICTICSSTFKKKEKLKHHMTIHTGERPFKCPHCEKSFRHSKVMKHHSMTHTGERPHVCIICSRGFIQKIALKKHMDSHQTI